MLDTLRSIMTPAGYHGHGRRPPFFEGWYFKLVDATEQHRLAIIPGISLAPDSAKTHAFVQLLDGSSGRSAYREYEAKDFACPSQTLDLSIRSNRFTGQGITVDVDTPGFGVRGSVNFGPLTPWPVTLTSPGIMGWYGWMPFMECYHGVLSMDHSLAGRLAVDGREVDFTGGRGYIEKDWGRSFPSAWIWMQTNHFDEPGVSLSASVAIIPWIGRSFPGFIVGLLRGGRLHRFATYTGARLARLSFGDTEVSWTVRDREHELTMRATRSAGSLLRAPSTTAMDRRIAESLTAVVDITLTDVGSGRVVFTGRGRNAGLEVGGRPETLLAMAQEQGASHTQAAGDL